MTGKPAAILVKLGGSLLTDKTRPETARPEVLDRLAGEIARAAGRLSPDGPRIVLGHGSGSFGHVAARAAGLGRGPVPPERLAPGASGTQERAAELHRRVLAALAGAGLHPFSIAPSSCVVADRGEIAAFAAEPVILALQRGLVPVLYGDVVLDRSWGASICSTERALAALVPALEGAGLGAARALWFGETDGLLDARGGTIRAIPRGSAGAEAFAAVGAAAGTDVTGGMRHRLETVFALARRGVPSLLANGLVPGLVERALAGESVPGTEVEC
jgi:isopentenyl phosphate kinase